MQMNLYHVWRTDNWSWDDYDSFVVAAESEIEAKQTHPGGKDYQKNWVKGERPFRAWPDFGSELIKAELIGKAEPGKYTETTVIVVSSNAG